MASPWPSTLPQNQFVGMTEVRADARIRTTMDAGPAKMRRRFTVAVRTFEAPLILNGTQKQTFDSFWISTLQEGTLSFSWTDPVTDAAVNFRFVAPPTWTLDVGGATSSRVWRTKMSIEILP